MASTGDGEDTHAMTPEQRQQQQAEYTRQLLDAVYEPDLRKKQQIQATRRRNRLKKLKQEKTNEENKQDQTRTETFETTAG